MCQPTRRCLSLEANKIVECARECVGTPFKHQGRLINIGMDCAGLIAHIMNRFGLPCVDEKGYPRTPVDGKIKRILDSEPSLEPISELEAGCVILFRITKEPQHVAIYTGAGMIHSFLAVGKVVESGMGEAWKRRIVKMYRFKL
jgi:cell wall-associated NlpC family hydrolase